MQSDPLPKYDDFMLPTLKALSALGGSASIDEIRDWLVADMGLSEEQLDLTYSSSGAAIAVDRMSWARSRMKPAGFVASGGKGVWVLTDLGREAAAWPASKVKKAAADAYKLIASQKKESPADDEVTTGVTELDWSERLIDQLRHIDPSSFERLCQRILRESGFVRVEVTGKSGDGGIDGVGVLRMNLISFQVLFQCKRYTGSVAAGAVRDFRGAMQGRADKGLIITTGGFTADARKEATRDGAPAIDLIDGEALCDLLKQLRLGVKVEQVVVERITVDGDFLNSI